MVVQASWHVRFCAGARIVDVVLAAIVDIPHVIALPNGEPADNDVVAHTDGAWIVVEWTFHESQFEFLVSFIRGQVV